MEKANNGTLYIDNINELPLDAQNKLLRVITDQRFKRLNDTLTVKSNFRVIASSSENLKQNTIDGSFREDLFHRLNVIYFYLPPLIERSTDIPLLINYFFKKFKGENYEYKNKIKNIDLFYDYNWPGNIRELRNLVERIVILAQDDVDKVGKLVYNYFNSNLKIDKINSSKSDLTLKEARDNFEREYLIKQLKINDGNVSKTAKSVGMERSALHRKLSLLNIKY